MHLLPATSRSIAVAAVTVTTVGVLPVFLVGVLSVQLRADLSFGPAELGVLTACFFAGSISASMLAGSLARRLSSRAVVRGAASASALSMLGMAALARDLPSLAAALALGGCANGLGQPASNALIASAVSEGRQGLAFGLKQAAIPLSTLLGGLAVPLIAIPYGWRWAFALGGALAVFVALSVPGPTGGGALASPRPTMAAGPFRRAPLLVLSFGLMLAAACGNALAAFFVASVVASGIAPGDAGLLAAFVSVGGVVTRVLLGWIADRKRTRWLIVVAAQMAAGALGYALLASGRPLLMAAGGMIGYCFGWAWAGLATYAVARMHFGMTARATGYTQAAVGLGSAIGPLSFGPLVVATSYETAWYATAGISLLAALVCLLGRYLLLRNRPALVQAHRARRVERRAATPQRPTRRSRNRLNHDPDERAARANDEPSSGRRGRRTRT